MDVFQLRDRIIKDYSSYIGSFIQIHDDRIKQAVDKELNDGLLWPDPLLQLNPAFAWGGWIEELVSKGLLVPDSERIFRGDKSEHDDTGRPMRLYQHQVDAIEAARTGDNYVLTTGTGSGKSLSYIVPIVDYVLRHGSGKGIKAIIVYPMNALANSQELELRKFLCHGYGNKPPVTFRRYTGQEGEQARQEIVTNPPDILLTNYVMLELILTRPYEKKLVEAALGLQFLVFDELHTRSLVNEEGRMGCVLPSGIATDDTTKFFFQDLVETKSLVSLFDFENKGIFPGVHSSYKFCLLTAGRGTKPTAEQAEFVFFAHSVDDLRDQQKRFSLTAHDIELLNPNTRTCPIFRTRNDAELTKAIYRRVPVLIREARDGEPEQNPWGIKFGTMFHMSNDSHLFRTREQLEADGWELDGNVFRKGDEEYLPLYEAKMIHHFDHRWATYDGLATRDLELAEKQNPDGVARGRYWVRREDIADAFKNTAWKRKWLLGWRDITNTTNERTVIFSYIPPVGVGHTCPIFLSSRTPVELFCLQGNLSAIIFDYAARQKIGGTHLTYGYLNQLPVQVQSVSHAMMAWDASTNPLSSWLIPRILELTYTAKDLQSFAHDCGFDGPPFRWDEDRRFLLRCELDAAFFHLYLPAKSDGNWEKAENETTTELASLQAAFPTPRHAVDYIMDTFPIVKRKDEAKYGEYRTKRTILEIYDAMQNAIATGQPYQTRLDPPPADRRCCHPERS